MQEKSLEKKKDFCDKRRRHNTHLGNRKTQQSRLLSLRWQRMNHNNKQQKNNSPCQAALKHEKYLGGGIKVQGLLVNIHCFWIFFQGLQGSSFTCVAFNCSQTSSSEVGEWWFEGDLNVKGQKSRECWTEMMGTHWRRDQVWCSLHSPGWKERDGYMFSQVTT